ncbi:MAG: curli-like amyloid fiber formation chaperone CsgH [Lutibacter sp.]|uniref:curli-like amyloid fiber formation chaperone CsgH n=1 Tax=Lutibacter sp. TaxID=1925666 RepID=UPI0038594978
MKYFFLNTIFCYVSLFCIHSYSQLSETVVGKINISEKDNLIFIRALVENEELTFKNNLEYNLVALKKGVSGNYTSNRQSGEFSLKPEERKSVSEIRLNIEKNEEIKVFLFIKQNAILVSKDSIVIIPKNQNIENAKIVNEDDFALKGIVIDEVITKIGKDFHDYFYQNYSTSGVQYPFIIVIKEKPYFGRSSIVSIEVDDRKIYEFLTKPDEDFLKGAVKQTLQNLSQYARQRKLLFKNSRI